MLLFDVAALGQCAKIQSVKCCKSNHTVQQNKSLCGFVGLGVCAHKDDNNNGFCASTLCDWKSLSIADVVLYIMKSCKEENPERTKRKNVLHFPQNG